LKEVFAFFKFLDEQIFKLDYSRHGVEFWRKYEKINFYIRTKICLLPCNVIYEFSI
jgi:hypothetical protein